MNSQAQTIQSILSSNTPNSIQQVFPSLGSGFKHMHFLISLPRFNLFISKVNIHDIGLDLIVSLSFSNGEPLNISKPYIQSFLQKLNASSQKVVYDSTQNFQALKLTCSLSSQILGSSSKIIEECCRLIKDDQKILEKALQAIGIIKPKGKYSIKLKTNQLSLKKTVFTQIKNKRNCQKSQQISFLKAPIIEAKKIQQINNQNQQVQKTKKGGYFQVKRVQCKIFDEFGCETVKNLACKTARKNKKIDIPPASKLQKEISLASKIVDPTHFVNYYVEDEQKTFSERINRGQMQKLYMDYFPDLLKEQMYKQNLSARNLILLSKQLISAVDTMHRSGIVHRDLKPQNIILQRNAENMCLKIIDFGESTLIQQQYNKNCLLGCTLPYSPVECVTRSEIGFNKPEIDLWSVSMILYEMTFHQLPMFYSRCIGPEIIQTWKSKKQFSIYPIYRKRSGFRGVEELISIITMTGLQIQQSDRLQIPTLKRIFEAIEQYIQIA